MLTGRPPFKAESPLETLQQVQSQEPVSPSRLQPKLPRDLATICLRCLAKDPRRHYASAAALAEDLHRFLEGEPILARPVGSLERLGRWCRRKPALADLVGSVSLLLVVIAVGASASAWLLGQERDEMLSNLGRAEKAETGLRNQLGETKKAGRGRRDQLWQSYRDEARARRFGRQPGQRLESLGRLREAAQLVRSLNLGPEALQQKLLELRSEAIACLALPDLREIRRWPGRFELPCEVGFDTPLERYAQSDRRGIIHIRRVSDDAELVQLTGPGVSPKSVRCLFSPDGRRLAVWYELDQRDLRLMLWDLPARKRIFADSVSTLQVGFTFSPDSHWLAFCSQREDRIRLVDCRQGHEGKSLGSGMRASHVAFHPNGRQLAFTSESFPTVGIVDLESGEIRAMLPDADVNAPIAWSPDGRLLAAAGADGVGVWDVPAAQAVGDLRLDQCDTAAFQPHGHYLATDGKVSGLRLWPLRSGPPEAPPVLHVGPPQVVPLDFPQHFRQRACWSRDGQWLAAVNERSRDSRALLLNAQRPTEVRTLGAVPRLATIAVSADGQWVVGGTWDQNFVRVWQAANPKVFHDLPDYGNAAFSPDGRWLVTAGEDDYCCWRVGSWQPRRQRRQRRQRRREESTYRITPLAFAPAGDLLALTLRPQEIDPVDPGSGQVLARLATPTPALITGGITAGPLAEPRSRPTRRQ